jgi:hypothetical protein
MSDRPEIVAQGGEVNPGESQLEVLLDAAVAEHLVLPTRFRSINRRRPSRFCCEYFPLDFLTE